MRLSFAAALLLSFAATPAAAQQQWYHVGGNHSTHSYVDLASLRPIGDTIVGDIQSIYAEPLQGGIVGTRIRTEFHCVSRTFRTLEYSYYGDGGKFLRSEPSNSINTKRSPAPGSINEAILDFVCVRKGGTPTTDIFADADKRF